MVECTRVLFEIGVISDALELAAAELDVAGKVMYRVGAAAVRHQKIVAAETRDLKVPLITT